MLKTVQAFLKSENGAVTVDWVMLTAATSGPSGSLEELINSGAVSASDHMGSTF